jgi:hypothetical protein
MLSYNGYSARELYENGIVQYFQEAFQLSSIQFGTNETLDDNQVEKVHNKISTYFLLGQTKYKVDLISDGSYYHVKFSYWDKDKYNYEMKYDLDSSLKIFNSVMYVVSEITNSQNINGLAFSAHESNPKLKSLYSKMVKNKSFLRVMSENGFEFDKEEDDIYFYQRKS